MLRESTEDLKAQVATSLLSRTNSCHQLYHERTEVRRKLAKGEEEGTTESSASQRWKALLPVVKAGVATYATVTKTPPGERDPDRTVAEQAGPLPRPPLPRIV